jgi:hypothetical protein
MKNMIIFNNILYLWDWIVRNKLPDDKGTERPSNSFSSDY